MPRHARSSWWDAGRLRRIRRNMIRALPNGKAPHEGGAWSETHAETPAAAGACKRVRGGGSPSA
ncbi:hypothetical protein CBM2610_A120199 [Cupriavidus taiwanensis]|nr:hypothetical protein CBM2610_A120199 [Cupriavidus taiwanensis]